jgi:hypothetical protein
VSTKREVRGQRSEVRPFDSLPRLFYGVRRSAFGVRCFLLLSVFSFQLSAFLCHATTISIVLAWDPASIPTLVCPVVRYRIYDCAEDFCHPGTCQVAAEVGAGKLTTTIRIDDSVTHVFFATAIGQCGQESRPSNQVSWQPEIVVVQRAMAPDNLRWGP